MTSNYALLYDSNYMRKDSLNSLNSQPNYSLSNYRNLNLFSFSVFLFMWKYSYTYLQNNPINFLTNLNQKMPALRYFLPFIIGVYSQNFTLNIMLPRERER